LQNLSDFIQKELNSFFQRIQNLSTRFGQSFDNFDSFIHFFESFADVQSDINKISQKTNCFFEDDDSLLIKIKSLFNHILRSLDKFDQYRNQKFNQLYQLFGIGVKPEFPISPIAFVLFIDSISDKIIKLHEKSNK
jgi:hypothetical protein